MVTGAQPVCTAVSYTFTGGVKFLELLQRGVLSVSPGEQGRGGEGLEEGDQLGLSLCVGTWHRLPLVQPSVQGPMPPPAGLSPLLL